MKPFKVDFLIRSLDHGGAERQLVILASGLARRGHQVRILTFYGGGHYEAEARSLGLEVLDLHKKGRWDLIPFLLRQVFAWQAYRPDLIHSYMGGANLVAAVLKPFHRRPLIWGLRSSNIAPAQLDRMTGLTTWLEARFSSWADMIIANSEAGRACALSQGFPDSKLCVVNNGFDCDYWTRNPKAGIAFRLAHGLPLECPLLGVVGRLDPAKGHEVFIQSAAKVSRIYSQVHYLIVGAGLGSYRDELYALAASLGLQSKIHWVPGQQDMVAVYSALDGLVSASHTEGFPNVVAEAMSCGLKPVVTNVGDSSLVIGPWGWTVPPNDSDSLAAGMGAWLADWESSGGHLSLSPRTHIETSFGVDRLVGRTETLMQTLL